VVEVLEAGLLDAPPKLHAKLLDCASSYRANEPRAARGRRVLVTGFGPFGPHARNVTSEIASAFAGGRASRPVTGTRAHVVDAGPVRAVVLPVIWDLAAIVALREIDAFAPDVVLMNGIASASSPVTLERGACNVASARFDATGEVRPHGKGPSAIVPSEPRRARALPFDFTGGLAAARDALEPGGVRARTSAARESNAYLCNQLTYLVDLALGTGRPLRLLRAHHAPEGVSVRMSREHAHVKRVFVHWPSNPDAVGAERGCALLRALADTA
jgi:pyrrolidone-carboxylate peptidase